jgi:hypothetical protein
MSPELTKQLYEKYPKIFAGHKKPITESLMAFGFECGDGWYNIIDTLCSWLQWNTDKNSHIDYYKPQVEAVQVKEKFGTLRFYVNGASEVQYAAISMAESMSARTCEECGKPGKIYTDGWYRTLCEDHARESGRVYSDEGP